MTYPPAGDPQQPYQPPGHQPPSPGFSQPAAHPQPAGYPQADGYPQSAGYPQADGYPQPGYQAPPPGFPPTGQFQPVGSGGQQSGSGKWLLLIAGAFLALLVVVVGGWFFVQRVLVDSPTDVTERYLDAVNDRDRAAVVDMVCSSERSKALRGSDYVDDDDDDKTTIDWKILSETKGRNSAEVRARVTLHDPESDRTQSVNISVTLVKEGGDWMICGVRTD